MFALGLSIVVAPQTAVVLADAEERNAGAASGVNNAIGRIAALLGVAGFGLVIATGFSAELDRRLDPDRLSPAARVAVADAKANPMTQPDLRAVPAVERPALARAIGEASVSGLHLGAGSAAGIAFLAGLLGAGLRNPRRAVKARECAGGALVAAPRDAARRPEESREKGTAPAKDRTLSRPSPAPRRRSTWDYQAPSAGHSPVCGAEHLRRTAPDAVLSMRNVVPLAEATLSA